MVYGMDLTYDEIVHLLNVKYIAGSTRGYTLPPGICETSDKNLIIISLPAEEVELYITIDDIRLKSNLTTQKTIRITQKAFFLYDIRLYLITLRSFKSKDLFTKFQDHIKAINFLTTAIDKIHLKCGCINGSPFKVSDHVFCLVSVSISLPVKEDKKTSN